MGKIYRNRKILRICLIVYIAMAIILMSVFKNFILLYAFFVGGIVLFPLAYNYFVKREFKLKVIASTLQEIKPSIRYEYHNKTHNYKGVIKSLKMIPAAASFKFQDFIYDDIDGISYVSTDLLATHQQSTGKSTVTITDFKGKMYDISLPSNGCDFVLRQEKKKRNPEGFESLELESIDFNDYFNLYVTDTHEAHKIFTPSMIQRCVSFVESFPEDVMFAFIGEHLYLWIKSSEDHFESLADYKEKIKSDYEKQLSDLNAALKLFTK